MAGCGPVDASSKAIAEAQRFQATLENLAPRPQILYFGGGKYNERSILNVF